MLVNALNMTLKIGIVSLFVLFMACTAKKCEFLHLDHGYLPRTKSVIFAIFENITILWARSEELFGFSYVEMLSDGDSSSFKAVTDLAPYGPNVKIEKLKCILY